MIAQFTRRTTFGLSTCAAPPPYMTQLRYVGFKMEGPNTRMNHANPRMLPLNDVRYGSVTIDRLCGCGLCICALGVVSTGAKG
jgi:hypothetical protein